MENIIPRELEAKILRFAKDKEIIIIRGPRQAGKTTLLKLIAETVKSEKVFIDLDIPENRNALADSPMDFIDRFGKGRKLTLFLDEVQRVTDAGEKLKIIYDQFADKGVKVFASGSSSLDIKTNVLGFLVGRALIFDLLTLGFGEFLNYKDEGLFNIFKMRNDEVMGFIAQGNPIKKPAFTSEILKYWKEYVLFGGYPAVVKTRSAEDKKIRLKNIYGTYIEKDIVSFFGIGKSSLFEDFVVALSFNTANSLTLSSVAADSGITHYAAKEFLNILVGTYVIGILRPYYRNATTAIKKAPKVYFIDLGLRNAAIGNYSVFDKRDDRGKIGENFVYRELIGMGYEINYWRTKSGAEVDFLIKIEQGIIPVEVKLGGARTLGKSFYSFIERYKPKRALIVTLDHFGKEKIGGTEVYWVPIFYL